MVKIYDQIYHQVQIIMGKCMISYFISFFSQNIMISNFFAEGFIENWLGTFL